MPEIVGRLRPPRIASAPSSPSVGETYYDTVLNASRYWNGTAWVTTDLRYNGDWAAGSYTDGDIVVYNGTSYMCVRPTSSAPTGWTPVYSAVGYGTSLPASPVDGQEYVLVDSTTGPSYSWRFRYNASNATAYKWEFVGGAPWLIRPADYTPASAGSFFTDSAAGSTITVPRAGNYVVHTAADIGATASNTGNYLALTPDQNFRYGQIASASQETSISLTERLVLAAAATIRNDMLSNGAAAPFTRRVITALPVAVA